MTTDISLTFNNPYFVSERRYTVYSPKINAKHIPILYHLGKHVKKPMTHLVNEAITEYLAKAEPLIRK